MNGQLNITLVINYEYDERVELTQEEIATKVAGLIEPDFCSVCEGISITDISAFYEDTNIYNY